MRSWFHWARQIRASRRQLWLSIGVSASVCLLILLSVGGPAGWDAASLNALRARALVGAGGSGSGSSTVGSGDGSLPGSNSAGSLPSGGSPAAASASGGGSGNTGSGDSGSGGSGSSGSGSGSDSTGSSGKSDSHSGSDKGASKPSAKSPIKHVFVISLAANDYADAFGPSSLAPYLNGTLRPRGELLSDYKSVSGVPLADSLALIGGQKPNADTEDNCPTYTDFPAGHGPDKHNLMPGDGCVYPNTVLTLGDQFDGADLQWRGFIDGMSSACQHPNSDAADAINSSGYDPRENPFVFFHSLLDLGDCQSYDLPLGKLKPSITAAPKHVPSFVYISADPCDGGATGCPNPTTPPGGTTSTEAPPTTTTTSGSTDPTVVAADTFLRSMVPTILQSAAYRKAGALLILFSPTEGAQQAGARTGALVLSPFVQAGSTDSRPTDAYSTLRTIEKIFALTPLGMAREAKPIRLIKAHKG